MEPQSFVAEAPGRLIPMSGIRGSDYAFVPDPLPPHWRWPEAMWPLLLKAHRALATLNGVAASLPDPQLMLRPLFQREAERSSSLEGTFTPPRQQALFQLDPESLKVSGQEGDDYREIANYRQALQAYFENPNALPISLRLIRQLHATLLDSVRGADKQPGDFRRVQVHIGLPPRFVPPPPNELAECLNALEHYVHAPGSYDPLVDAFLVHYQFEAIHPFRDGNGRVGRLLLSIMITERCEMSAPWLHMSAYFDANKNQYIDKLLRVSTHNDWQGWIEFCLQGAVAQARDTEARCRRLIQLRQAAHNKIGRIRGASRLGPLIDRLFSVPVLTIPYVVQESQVTYATARNDIEKLVQIGLLEPAPEAVRPKAYYAAGVLEIISGQAV